MKKLLLAGVAAFALAGAAAPASAEVNLDLGGFFKGYGSFVDQDELAGTSVRSFDILRHTELHGSGETTLDNGLTVGAHIEAEVDGVDAAGIEESYVYFSGGWGRINFGAEDGANYLLQVAAPSADSNVDGIRQYVNPFNGASFFSAANAAAITAILNGTTSVPADPDNVAGGFNLDYENNASGYADKLTYLTPVISGFQAGVSYTPDMVGSGFDFVGNSLSNTAGSYGSAYEVAARYEGEFQGVGVTAGAGWTKVDLESAAAGLDDQTQWNAGLDLNFEGFGLGAIYTTDDYGRTSAAAVDEEKTIVVGADYTTGAFKVGVSYLTQDNSFSIKNLDTDRYTGGVVYTYGPGMTFRGSVQYLDVNNGGAGGAGTDSQGTAVLLGTQINF